MSQEERDAALASLIHVLEPASYPLEDYIEALNRSDNDVSRAAELLLLGMGQPSNGRKRSRGIEQFMKPKRSPAPSSSPKKRVKANSRSASPSPKASPPDVPTQPAFDREAQKASWSSLLKAPAPTRPPPPAATRLPSLRLGTPEAVKASGIPVAVLSSPLSAQFAAQLYHVMMAESPKWNYNKFFLNGRECMSNHSSSTYSRTPKVRGHFSDYLLSGSPISYFKMPPELEKAAELVEDAVNEYLDSVPRFPLEYRGRWRANMCGANRYDGAASTVGFHADQLTNLGPYPTIASLSLGVPRAFRLRPTASELDDGPLRTYEMDLGHNSLVLMTPGCQERFKHTIPPQRAIDIFRPQWDVDGKPILPEQQETSTSRINITFRFYREDFLPERTPKCKCDLPMCLRADQKGKVRAAHGVRSKSVSRVNGREIVDDGMAFFWQCQASRAGKPECGGFKLLDIRAEGRGPCMGDEGPDVEDFDELSVKAEGVDAASATVERPVSDERKQEATLKPTREPERECKQETKQAFKQEPSPVIDQK